MKIVKEDIVGKRYGSLTVMDNYEIRGIIPNRKVYWLCKCDCGNEFSIESSSLKRRKVMYCNKCRPAGILYKIDNISRFCKEHNLNISNVSAALHGRCQYKKSDWKFFSNKNKL